VCHELLGPYNYRGPTIPQVSDLNEPAAARPQTGYDDLARYRWVAMGVVLVGTFMVILDTSIVNVALPQIGVDFHSIANVEWIVTAYLLALGLAQPPTGWLTDRFGKRKVFCGCMLLFSLGSLLCAIAPNLGVLVAFRVLQGFGGGGLPPVGLAIIYELFPADQRGSALGIWGVAAMAAPAIGPVLGGWLVTAVSWRALFLINVPIGAIGLVLGVRLLRDVVPLRHRRLDWKGLLMATGGLGALLLGLSEAPRWGWSSPTTIACLLVGAVLTTGWVIRGLREPTPLVDMWMFRERGFSLCMVVLVLLTMAQYGRLVFIPLELESLRHLSALRVGVLLVPTALGAAATMPIGGRLADRIGPRLPTVLGVACIGLSTLLLSRLTLHTSEVAVALYLAIGGVGLGLSLMPTTVAALLALPNRMAAEASSLRTLSRQVAGSLGLAVLSTVIATRLAGIRRPPTAAADIATAQSAYNVVFAIAAASCVLALIAALGLPGGAETRRLQALRGAEPRDGEASQALAVDVELS
jgi:EmrB/QacA subfamily drug resistance transporter